MTLSILTGERVSNINRRLVMAVATVRSPFTGQDQAQDWGGRWWAYDLQIGPFRGGDSRPLVAGFTALEATAGRFLFADPTAVYKGDYFALGSPTVSGAGQTGRSLVTTGWQPYAVLRAGMCFSLGADTTTRMHMVTSNVSVDASGNATLAITPPLRESPAGGAALDYNTPKVQLRVPQAVTQQIASGAYYTFAVTAEEAL